MFMAPSAATRRSKVDHSGHLAHPGAEPFDAAVAWCCSGRHEYDALNAVPVGIER